MSTYCLYVLMSQGMPAGNNTISSLGVYSVRLMILPGQTAVQPYTAMQTHTSETILAMSDNGPGILKATMKAFCFLHAKGSLLHGEARWCQQASSLAGGASRVAWTSASVGLRWCCSLKASVQGCSSSCSARNSRSSAL